MMVLLMAQKPAAQQFHSQHYTIREGLPSNKVRAFYRDSRNILWVGTDAGLATYDGAKLRKVELPSELESKSVWAIAEDENGILWLGTYGGGLVKYDGRNFTCLTTPQLPDNHIRVMKYSQRFKGLWVGTQLGFSFISKGDIFSFFPDGLTRNRFLVMGFIETDEGAIFHTFSHGAFHFNLSTREVKPLPPESPLQVQSSSVSFVTSGKDTIVGLYKNGLRIISKDGVRDFHDLGQVFHVEEAENGHLWISAWSYTDMKEPGGLFYYDGHTMSRAGPAWGVSSPLVWNTFRDTLSGAILVATDGDGFHKLIDKGISRYPASFFGSEQLNIYDITVYRGNIWATAEDRVIVGNEKTGFVVKDEDFFNRQEFFPGHQTDSAIINPTGRFLGIYVDQEQNLWLGAVNALYRMKQYPFGFWRFNLGKRFSENFIVFPDGKAFSGAWSYFRIAPNILTSDKFYFKKFQPQYPTDVNHILRRQDEIWFSSFSHGLYRYSSGQFQWFGEDQPELPRHVSSLTTDQQANLIAGTHDGRVLILEGSDSLLVKYELNSKKGITGNEVLWLLSDSHNRLWVGTNMGLNVIDLDELYREGSAQVRHINESEGYLDYQVRSAVEDINGIIWLGGKDNLVRIDPQQLLRKPASLHQVELTGFTINYKEVIWDSITRADAWRNIPTGKIALSSDQNNLNFSFSTNNILNPDKVSYSYFLEGLSSEPSPFSSHNEVAFNNLSPGVYTLRVEAVNKHSLSQYKPLLVKFRIRHPWWEMWYFYTLVVVVIMFFIFFIMRLRVLRVKKLEQIKLEHEKRLNSIRIQAVQAQMNPHFVFNVLSSIQFFMIDNNMDATMEYLSDFSVLIRKTMENMSEESIFLVDEIEYLKRYIKLEDLRLGNTIHSRIIIGKDIDLQSIRIPPMIIQPFVENAIKHGLAPKTSDRKLCISFQKSEGILHICVYDNGGGFGDYSPHQRTDNDHTSKGISITIERIGYYVDSCNQTVKNKFGVSITNRQRAGLVKGVKVEIRLPLIDS